MTMSHGAGYYLGLLRIPSDPGLIEALGELVIAHTHLELLLRYTVKTITGLSINEALDATSQDRAADLRERIKQLFKDKKPTATEKTQLDALLHRAKRLTEQRNDYLHSAWAVSDSGQAILKGEDHSWGPAPSQDQVKAVTADILKLSKELTDARLRGFIYKASHRQGPTSLQS